MENDDREKYLKRLKQHNKILMVVMIVAVVALIFSVFDYVREVIFMESYYYGYRFKSTYPPNNVVQAFNSDITRYGGEQTGSQVKALLQKLIDNTKTYKEDASKIPKVEYRSSNGEVIYSDNRIESVAYGELSEEGNFLKKVFIKYFYGEDKRRIELERKAEKQDKRISTEFIENDGISSYIDVLSNIQTKLRSKHCYNVEFEYKWDQIISTVIINEE